MTTRYSPTEPTISESPEHELEYDEHEDFQWRHTHTHSKSTGTTHTGSSSGSTTVHTTTKTNIGHSFGNGYGYGYAYAQPYTDFHQDSRPYSEASYVDAEDPSSQSYTYGYAYEPPAPVHGNGGDDTSKAQTLSSIPEPGHHPGVASNCGGGRGGSDGAGRGEAGLESTGDWMVVERTGSGGTRGEEQAGDINSQPYQPSVRTSRSSIEGDLPAILRHHQSIVTFLLSEKQIGPGGTQFVDEYGHDYPNTNGYANENGKRKAREIGKEKEKAEKGTSRKGGNGVDVSAKPVEEAEEIKTHRQQRQRSGGISTARLPLLIIPVQLVLLALAWTFVIYCLIQGPILLPVDVGDYVRRNPQVVTLIATLSGFVLGGLGSRLYSLSIQYLLANCLVNPRTSHSGLSLRSLDLGLHLIYGRVLFGGHVDNGGGGGGSFWRSLVTVVSKVVTAVQIVSWATLLTPTPVSSSSLIQNPRLGFGIHSPLLMLLILLPINLISLSSVVIVLIGLVRSARSSMVGDQRTSFTGDITPLREKRRSWGRDGRPKSQGIDDAWGVEAGHSDYANGAIRIPRQRSHSRIDSSSVLWNADGEEPVYGDAPLPSGSNVNADVEANRASFAPSLVPSITPSVTPSLAPSVSTYGQQLHHPQPSIHVTQQQQQRPSPSTTPGTATATATGTFVPHRMTQFSPQSRDMVEETDIDLGNPMHLLRLSLIGIGSDTRVRLVRLRLSNLTSTPTPMLTPNAANQSRSARPIASTHTLRSSRSGSGSRGTVVAALVPA